MFHKAKYTKCTKYYIMPTVLCSTMPYVCTVPNIQNILKSQTRTVVDHARTRCRSHTGLQTNSKTIPAKTSDRHSFARRVTRMATQHEM